MFVRGNDFLVEEVITVQFGVVILCDPSFFRGDCESLRTMDCSDVSLVMSTHLRVEEATFCSNYGGRKDKVRESVDSHVTALFQATQKWYAWSLCGADGT